MKNKKCILVFLFVLLIGLVFTHSNNNFSPEALPTVVNFQSVELQHWIPSSKDYYVCATILQVRTGPRYGAPVAGILYVGKAVTVTEYFDGWGMIAPARWVKLESLCERK